MCVETASKKPFYVYFRILHAYTIIYLKYRVYCCIPLCQPTTMHSIEDRDGSFFGHSFDSFYHHFGVLGYEVELGIANNGEA